MLRQCVAVIGLLIIGVPAAGQTPRPFPRPAGEPRPAEPSRPEPPRDVPAVPPTAPEPAVAPAPVEPPVQVGRSAPDPSVVVFPVYPAAQFITSVDAGLGQRYYLYGATATFDDMVNYYATQLRERGTRVFDEPPTHMFEVGRFRRESMAFPPGVTIKDWTWHGSAGYLDPNAAADGERFPTVIMIVPPPASTPR